MKFGDYIKMLREEKGITQKELGKFINVSDRVIGYYESNDRFPKDEITLRKIADYFDVSVDYLLSRTSIRSLQDNVIKTKASHSLDVTGLPDEAIKQVTDYIELIRLKYITDRKTKGKP